MTYIKKAVMWCLIPPYRDYRMINGIILGLYIRIICGLYRDYGMINGMINGMISVGKRMQ